MDYKNTSSLDTEIPQSFVDGVLKLVLFIVILIAAISICSGYGKNKVTVEEANKQVAMYEDTNISDQQIPVVNCFVNSNLNPVTGTWNDAIFSCKVDNEKVVVYRCQSGVFSPVICAPYVGNVR